MLMWEGEAFYLITVRGTVMFFDILDSIEFPRILSTWSQAYLSASETSSRATPTENKYVFSVCVLELKMSSPYFTWN